jgi:hypothetical protein
MEGVKHHSFLTSKLDGVSFFRVPPALPSEKERLGLIKQEVGYPSELV